MGRTGLSGNQSRRRIGWREATKARAVFDEAGFPATKRFGENRWFFWLPTDARQLRSHPTPRRRLVALLARRRRVAQRPLAFSPGDRGHAGGTQPRVALRRRQRGTV